MSPPLRIDVFTDLVCPWCYIGIERLVRVVEAAAQQGTPSEVRHQPFLLRPDTPAGGFDIPEYLRRAYGGDPAAMFERVQAAARSEGHTLDLSRQTRMVPTLGAHTLLGAAAARGTQLPLLRALFAAYFDDARDISDGAVLAAVAEPHGFTPDEVAGLLADEQPLNQTRAAAQSAAQSGISGVPFFVFGGRLAVSGAQPGAALREVLERARAEQSGEAP